MTESFTPEVLPEEININEGFQINADGKRFLYEKDGVKYGRDFLPESPEMISLDEMLKAPEEKNFVL